MNILTPRGGTAEERWDDDLSNVLGFGQYIGRPKANTVSNATLEYNSAPDTSESLKFNSYLDWDYLSFFPGYDEYITVHVNSVQPNSISLRIINSNGAIVAQANGIDPSITRQYKDANTHYISLHDNTGAVNEYNIEFRHNSDDHNDYEPEATPIPYAYTETKQEGTIQTSADNDYFRVFIPGSYTDPYPGYQTTKIDVGLCTTSITPITMTLYSSYRDSSGRFRNLQQKTTYTTSVQCDSFAKTSWPLFPSGNLPAGWYFIKIQASETTGYKIRVGNSGSSASEYYSTRTKPINVKNYWDIMYNNTSKNRIFRTAGYISSDCRKTKPNCSDEYYSKYGDWYELDLTDLVGRLVTVDVYANDNTAERSIDPHVYLYSGFDNSYDIGYNDVWENPDKYWSITGDDDGGIKEENSDNDNNSHLSFKIVRGSKYMIRVGATNTEDPAGTYSGPYQMFIDVKANSSADPAMPQWY